MSRCRRMPFKVACNSWCPAGKAGRCSGYMSPPPSPWHAQPKCEVSR